MGLPPRIAIPILAVFAVLFLGVVGWFLRVGLGTTGSAFGPGTVASESGGRQGDARLQATPVPIATDPAGTFTVPQTGTGRSRNSNTLPGAGVGGGTPVAAPESVMQELAQLRARLQRDPKDVAALVRLGNMELDAQKADKAVGYYDRALAVEPNNTTALFNRGIALQALDRRADAVADFRRFLQLSPNDKRAPDARAALQQLGG